MSDRFCSSDWGKPSRREPQQGGREVQYRHCVAYPTGLLPDVCQKVRKYVINPNTPTWRPVVLRADAGKESCGHEIPLSDIWWCVHWAEIGPDSAAWVPSVAGRPYRRRPGGAVEGVVMPPPEGGNADNCRCIKTPLCITLVCESSFGSLHELSGQRLLIVVSPTQAWSRGTDHDARQIDLV